MQLVSVIVPVYNSSKYLIRCLDSIINQTYGYLEIICIDDGSTDDSGKIIDEYSSRDSRIIAIHKSNGGAASARNVGLDIAKGDIVAFVDSDDWIELNTYDECVKDMGNADLYMFGTNVHCNEYDGMDRTKSYPSEDIDFRNVDDDILINSTINIWNKLFKHDIIEKNKIRFPDGLMHEDHAFYWKYALNINTIKSTANKYYNHEILLNSVMGSHTYSSKAIDLIYVFDDIVENLAGITIYHQKIFSELFYQHHIWAYVHIPKSMKNKVIVHGLKQADIYSSKYAFIEKIFHLSDERTISLYVHYYQILIKEKGVRYALTVMINRIRNKL